MKLQLALDDLSLEEALALVARVHDSVDIIEIGTPLIYREGMRAVKLMKETFPHKEVLADMKIMDAGYYEAEEALAAGADYVTVLAVTDKRTMAACMEAAVKYGKEIVADMISVENLPERIRELEQLKVHGLAVHTGTDQQAAGRTPMDDLKVMTGCCRSAKISVAGGINQDTAAAYAALCPGVIIVGGGICHAPEPEDAAARIKRIMAQYEGETASWQK